MTAVNDAYSNSAAGQAIYFGRPGNYYTTFTSTENPISDGQSEGVIWTNGAATGSNWSNVQTDGAHAFGTQTAHAAPPYDDSLAHLNGFGPDNAITTVLHRAAGSIVGLEFEHLHRFLITNGNARGIEVDCWPDGGKVNIVRWNGPLNDFTPLVTNLTTNVSFNDGDVWFSQMVGQILTIKCNSNLVYQGDIGNDYPTGQPGIGFYVDTNGGTPGSNTTIGHKSLLVERL
jgi:hypothetical protein